MIYKLLKDKKTSTVNYVELTNNDGKKYHIPFNQSNTDYQAYLKWLDEGNTPLPADE
jgi:hypothetical protein